MLSQFRVAIPKYPVKGSIQIEPITKTNQEMEPQTSLSSSIDQDKYVLTNEEEKYVINYHKEKFLKENFKRIRLLNSSAGQLHDKMNQYFNEEKIRDILKTANQNKLQKLWHEEQRNKRIRDDNKRLMELVDKCNAKYFFSVMNEFSRGKLITNSHTIPYIKTLCFFFGRDKRFETELGLDFKKGLWIRGYPGVGKTFLLSCISQNELAPFEIHSMIHIAQKIRGGERYFIKDSMIVIDDVGSEEATINRFGTKTNWFKEYIELYYAKKAPFDRLIITTNCGFDEIQNKYGFPVRDRIKEMMNIIDVKGENLRGKS